MSDLIREVNEEVRQERFQHYAKRYGIYATIAVVLIVAGAIGYVVWQNMQDAARTEASVAFLEAIQQSEADPAAARARLEALAEDAPAGYRVLARMRAATLAAESGDAAQAVADFDTIASDGGVDPLYRDLARVFAVANGMSILGPDEVGERIGAMDTPDHRLRFTARQLLAASALKAGDETRAKELLGAIVDDPAAPAGSRRLAAELLATLES